MAKSKKYDSRISQDGATWQAQIVRQVTLKKTVVSKKQAGFQTEAEAEKWAREKLIMFSKNLIERNKRHAGKRQKKVELLAKKEREKALVKAAKIEAAELIKQQENVEEPTSIWVKPKETAVND